MAQIKFIETNTAITKTIERILIKEVNAVLKKTVPLIAPKFKNVIRSSLISSPEISSLRNGILRGEFGLESDVTTQLVEAILATLTIKVLPAKSKFLGGIQIVMQPTSYINLFGREFAEQQIANGSIPWLKWLLTFGDSIIITGFGVEFGSFPQSRSGDARMSDKFAPYKVNSAFSGTAENNFITRSIERARPELEQILRGVL